MYQEVRWTDWSEDHIRRHDVAAGEVEQVLFSRPRWIAKGRDGTTLVFGSTTSGRPLLVVRAEVRSFSHYSRTVSGMGTTPPGDVIVILTEP